jgi:hypothetical protein
MNTIIMICRANVAHIIVELRVREVDSFVLTAAAVFRRLLCSALMILFLFRLSIAYHNECYQSDNQQQCNNSADNAANQCGVLIRCRNRN